MRFYWESKYFNFSPIVRFIVKKFKDWFDFFSLIILLVIFLICLKALIASNLKNKNLFYTVSLLLLIISVTRFRKIKAKEELIFFSAGEINVDDFLNKETKDFLLEKLTLAEIFKPESFSLYLLKEFLKNKKIKRVLKRAEIKEEIEKEIRLTFVKKTTEVINKLNYLDFLLKILKNAFDFSKKLNYSEINLYSVFLGLCFLDDLEINSFFEKQNIKKEYLLTSVLMESFPKKRSAKFYLQPLAVFHKEIEKRKLIPLKLFSPSTPFLDKYGYDLTLIACKQNLGFLIGHSEEVSLLEKLLTEGKRVILLGKEGSGKTTIIYNLAWKIHNELVSERLLDFRLIFLDLEEIFEKNKDSFDLIFKEIFQELEKTEKIILFLKNLDRVILNFSSYLEKLLSLKNLLLLGTLVPEQIFLLKSKSSYLNFFEKIEVKDLNEEEALYLLTLKSLLYEKENKVLISPQAIVLSLKLSRHLGKESDYFRRAESLILKAIELVKQNKGNFISEELIRELAISFSKEKPSEEILKFEDIFSQRIVNQKTAIHQISEVLKRYYAGLKSNKVLASFIFVGPIGVGKKETAKMIAKIIYGTEEAFGLISGNELQQENDFLKIIDFFQKKEFGLIFIDDFDKMNKNLINYFQTILANGFVEINFKKINFQNFILIFSSVSIYEEVKKELIADDLLENKIKEKLLSEFSEKFLTTIDKLIVFRELNFEEVFEIAKILSQKVKTDVLLKNNLYLEIDEKALKEIVKRSSFEKFGAKFIEKSLEEVIKNRLADLILRKELARGEKIILKFNEDFYLKKIL